ncbi:alpha/beta hydrolase [Paenibacillus sp. J2TS4]|uniref:RBBP9/YdeN family alpha/beta hydrolase n=1 Tax=Paenibacillus sp. J2TS4 TaxID=2807194 RepID=UPI001B111BD0|nr:alpha/beta hydrolase [Paenibacillus sp. J2TS4]GIP36099.1 alpha/beta hydrolase [Paenibacillus sp. J2TS4]
MKNHVLFIQGAGQGAYEADRKLASNLQDWLGYEYRVLYPRMPDEERPEYEAWRTRIAAYLSALEGEVIVVGHSLGVSILLKYLAEEKPAKPIAGLFLIASPYWGSEGWEVDEYVLDKDLKSRIPEIQQIFFYHSRDDEIVPFSHLALYAEMYPQAIIREFDGRGHQFNNDLFEVVQDIKEL